VAPLLKLLSLKVLVGLLMQVMPPFEEYLVPVQAVLEERVHE
jgi:hypothetical protein